MALKIMFTIPKIRTVFGGAFIGVVVNGVYGHAQGLPKFYPVEGGLPDFILSSEPIK